MIKFTSSRYHISLLLGIIFLIFIISFFYIFSNFLTTGPFWKKLVILLLLYILIVVFLIICQKWHEIKNTKTGNVQNQITQLQLISSLNQLNPHFMFNALNTISSLIMQKDSKVAYRCMIMLTKLMRYLLENSDRISCSLKEELDFVKNYLEIETIRYNKSFCYNLSINTAVDQGLLIPKMIIQLHVENAVKHGLIPKDGGSSDLNIIINQINKTTMIVITDNGIGRNASKTHQHDVHSTGKGIDISYKLIKLYNKLYRPQVSQQIEDMIHQDGTPAGTEIKISVKR